MHFIRCLIITVMFDYLPDKDCDFFSFHQSLTFKEKMTSLKFKEKPTDLETRSYKFLLLSLVKLIHADPKLLLCVSISYCHTAQL